VDVLLAAELTEDDPYYESRLRALTEALRGLGWIESKNLKLVIHRVTPRPADIRKQVTELLAERPDVARPWPGIAISSSSWPPSTGCQQFTPTEPG
jgi:hypothetical protein